MTWTMPTILTLLRLIAAPAMPLAFLLLPRPWADAVALGLFVGASVTDWLDGHLARRWVQVTRLGTMLDPIADKAMVAAALLTLSAMSSLSMLLILPAVLILFREVFVSGLREYLGDVSGTLKVTQLAKGKTAAQMVAIAVLLAHGIFEHRAGMFVRGMDAAMIETALANCADEFARLCRSVTLMHWSGWGGLALMWVAAALTVVTGVDYFRKALPHLKEPR